MLFRSVSLKDLSVYWNCVLGEGHLLKNQLDECDWKEEMLTSIAKTELLGSQFDYCESMGLQRC